MTSGGARARSGPAPDPNALHRERDEGEWVTLPAAGRAGAVPEFPLVNPSKRERQFWEQLWTMPQAVMWERQQQVLEVGLYVRRLVEAEKVSSAVNLSTLVRQMSDSLGLTTPGLRSNRWRIAQERPQTAVEERPVTRSRARLKVVAQDASGVEGA